MLHEERIACGGPVCNCILAVAPSASGIIWLPSIAYYRSPGLVQHGKGTNSLMPDTTLSQVAVSFPSLLGMTMINDSKHCHPSCLNWLEERFWWTPMLIWRSTYIKTQLSERRASQRLLTTIILSDRIPPRAGVDKARITAREWIMLLNRSGRCIRGTVDTRQCQPNSGVL